MPQPRALGTTAKTVVESIEKSLERNTEAYFAVVLHLYSEDREEALGTLREIAARNNLAVRALTFLRAGQLHEAENVLIDARLREKGAQK